MGLGVWVGDLHVHKDVRASVEVSRMSRSDQRPYLGSFYFSYVYWLVFFVSIITSPSTLLRLQRGVISGSL